MITPGGLMKVVKKSDKYVIFRKRSGRYGVRSMNRSWINGPEKERILSEEGLVDAPKVKVKKEEEKEPASDGPEQKEEDESESAPAP